MESGGGIVIGGLPFQSIQDLCNWYDERCAPLPIFADAMAIMQAMVQPVVSTYESNKNEDARQKVSYASDMEAALVASFKTVLPAIMVGYSTTDLKGGAADCLLSYLKSYSVWKPKGSRSSSGLGGRLKSGATTVKARLATLRNALTTHSEVKELALTMVSDSAQFIYDLVDWINTQNEELSSSSSLTPEQIWSLQIDQLAHLFTELYNVRGIVADAATIHRAHFVWGAAKAWEIQERYRSNHFSDDPAFTDLLVRRIMVHDGEQTLKDKLAAIEDLQDTCKALDAKLTESKREHNALLKRVQAVEKKEKK